MSALIRIQTNAPILILRSWYFSISTLNFIFRKWLGCNDNLSYNTTTYRIKLCLEGEMATGIVLLWFISNTNGLAIWLKSWKEMYQRNGGKDSWGRSSVMNLSKWAQSVEIFVFHTTLYQRAPTAKVGLKNLVEKLIHSRQVNLFPQLLQSCSMAPGQCGQDRDGSYASVQQYRSLLAAMIAKSPTCQSHRWKPCSQYDIIPQRANHTPGGS